MTLPKQDTTINPNLHYTWYASALIPILTRETLQDWKGEIGLSEKRKKPLSKTGSCALDFDQGIHTKICKYWFSVTHCIAYVMWKKQII